MWALSSRGGGGRPQRGNFKNNFFFGFSKYVRIYGKLEGQQKAKEEEKKETKKISEKERGKKKDENKIEEKKLKKLNSDYSYTVCPKSLDPF